MPTPRPTSQPTEHVHHVVTNGEEVLGHVTSVTESSEFNCSTRYSPLSEVGDDKMAEVTCENGEVMTDCSMVTKVTSRYVF